MWCGCNQPKLEVSNIEGARRSNVHFSYRHCNAPIENDAVQQRAHLATGESMGRPVAIKGEAQNDSVRVQLSGIKNSE